MQQSAEQIAAEALVHLAQQQTAQMQQQIQQQQL